MSQVLKSAMVLSRQVISGVKDRPWSDDIRFPYLSSCSWESAQGITKYCFQVRGARSSEIICVSLQASPLRAIQTVIIKLACFNDCNIFLKLLFFEFLSVGHFLNICTRPLFLKLKDQIIFQSCKTATITLTAG